MKKLDFLKLTTDICYFIGGYFDYKAGKNEYAFTDDAGLTVFLDLNENKLVCPNELSKIESFALQRLVFEYGLEFYEYSSEEGCD